MTAGLLWNRSITTPFAVLEIGIPWIMKCPNFQSRWATKKKNSYFPLYIYWFFSTLVIFNIGILIIPISLGCIKPQTNTRGPYLFKAQGCHKNLLLPHKSLLRCQLGGQLLLGALQWVAEVLFFLSSAWWTPDWYNLRKRNTKHMRRRQNIL